VITFSEHLEVIELRGRGTGGHIGSVETPKKIFIMESQGEGWKDLLTQMLRRVTISER
jgi:hypothetical protein